MTSVHITSESDIFVGFLDGTVCLFDARGNKTRLDRDCSYSRDHGDLVKVHYSWEAKLMVVAFRDGKIHLRKCTQSVTSSLTWRESCVSLQDVERTVCDMECLYLPGSDEQADSDSLTNSGASFEIWLGLDSDEIQVWKFSLSPEQVWMSDNLSQLRKLSCVRMTDDSVTGSGNCTVCMVKGSVDQSMVAGVLRTTGKSGSKVCLFDVASERCLQRLELNFSGMYYYCNCTLVTIIPVCITAFYGGSEL